MTKPDAKIEYYIENYSLMVFESHSNKSAVLFESNLYTVDSGGRGFYFPALISYAVNDAHLLIMRRIIMDR